MNNLLDWEYYNSHFPKLSEDEFNKVSYKAERIVLKRISKSVDDLSSDEQMDVKDCICDIINGIYGTNYSKGLASVSNDGYAESYATVTEEENEQKIENIINTWLGDTGLLKSKWLVF